MITKIDWYILKKFFTTFIFCMLLFTVIAVAVDSSEKTDDFLKTGLSTAQIIKEYYFGFIPHIWGLLYPLFVFIFSGKTQRFLYLFYLASLLLCFFA